MLDRSQLPLAVGHADVSFHMAFYSTAGYFHSGEFPCESPKDVMILDRVIEPLALADRAFAVVESDLVADVTMRDRGTLIIYGNVHSSIEAGHLCEVVIAGNVCEGASISGNGILSIFVGGDMVGCLRNCGSCKAWIEGNLIGDVWTGSPSTQLRVLRDCNANIRPIQKPSLLYLEVGGFLPYGVLEATAAVGYTQFHASVGRSDRPAGLYPGKAANQALRQHRSFNRWVIRDTATLRDAGRGAE